MVDLTKNENLYGPAPECLKIIKNLSIDHLSRYSRKSEQMIEELASLYRVPAHAIMLGYGSEDLLKIFFERLLKPGDRVLLPTHSWWYYLKLAMQCEADYHFYPIEREPYQFVTRMDLIYQMQLENDFKIILISTPNNPTGNQADLSLLEPILQITKQGIVIVDEAYVGFTRSDGLMSDLINRYPNLVSLRTFSKYFALAGLRMGFAFCGGNIKNWINYHDRILGYNHISEDIALAALRNPRYYEKISQRIAIDSQMMYEEINKMDGFTAFKSVTNFILFEYPAELREVLDQSLKESGYKIKFFTESFFPNMARISLGITKHNQDIIEILQDTVKNYASEQMVV